ncbi:unnamed protein product [Symbiodinium necroappetens]|uniref:Uncharacterized protein n=1 Tax=Symbiodinium necroappetens TaxID=1628268 RepID=A0A812QTS5_9DINO|nr:unnamed protein product [Symbiodinium necroappetens]
MFQPWVPSPTLEWAPSTSSQGNAVWVRRSIPAALLAWSWTTSPGGPLRRQTCTPGTRGCLRPSQRGSASCTGSQRRSRPKASQCFGGPWTKCCRPRFNAVLGFRGQGRMGPRV